MLKSANNATLPDMNLDAASEIQLKAKSLGVDVTSNVLAERLDEEDDLKHLRNEFFYPKMKDLPQVVDTLVDPEAPSIYFCGHSLGLQPKGVRKYFDRELEKWAKIGVHGHKLGETPWADCDEYAVEGCAELVGAQPHEIAVMNGLTVNIHLMLVSFYKPTAKRYKILLESKAFPSDHYAIESQLRFHGYDTSTAMICIEPRENEHCLRLEDILAIIAEKGDEIALIFLSSVQYYTGQQFDMQAITRAGHEKVFPALYHYVVGCIVGWDAAHAAGNVPLKLHDWDVDFAVWCSYKYMNTCAGGIGVVFVHERYAHDNRNRFLGWWSHEPSTRFQMTNVMELSPGAAGYRISNPPIFLICPLLASLDIFAKTDMSALRRKSLLLTGYLEILLDLHFGKESPRRDPTLPYCEILTPRNPAERGCALALKFSIDLHVVYAELQKRGVACDIRYPHVIRVAPIHLYNNFMDVFRFIEALRDSLAIAAATTNSSDSD